MPLYEDKRNMNALCHVQLTCQDQNLSL